MILINTYLNQNSQGYIYKECINWYYVNAGYSYYPNRNEISTFYNWNYLDWEDVVCGELVTKEMNQ